MSELAFNLSGEPFEVPAHAVGWRVRRMKQRGEKGAPEVVYGRDGLPLLIPIDADMSDLRRAVEEPGRLRLDPVADGMRPIEGAPAAYVQVASVIPPAQPEVAVELASASARPSAHVFDPMVEAMRMNTELAKSVIDGFPSMMQAAAVLIHAADGAGIAARPPFVRDGGDDDDVEADEALPPATEGAQRAGIDINALVAQVVPVIVMGLMNGKLDMSRLAELLDWRKAAAAGRSSRSAEASRPRVPTAGPTESTMRVPTAAAAPAASPMAPLDPAAMVHFLAVQAALTSEEAALAREVAKDLSPTEVRTWLDELRGLSVPDAAAKIRAAISTGVPVEEIGS